jgi:tetratricopeptide (TPR) repeat protein
MKYLDFDIEIGSGDGNTYPLVIRSAAGEMKETMRFPFDELALKLQLQALENAVLKSGQPHRKVLSGEAQTAQDFGRQLFEALLPGEARSLFSVSRNKATQEHLLGVRIRLHINAPELAALPWEYLYDSSAGEYLSLLKGSPIVRYPEMPLPIEPLKVTLPLRILGMIASPVDQDRLDVEHEKRRMEEALQEPVARGEVELVWIEGQTWEHLQEAMWRGPWHIFHFIGHGGFDKSSDEGLIALADEHGKTHLLGANDLGLLLMNQGSVRLALLNACQGAKSGGHDAFSSTAATLARRGIPAVLAMQEDISDRAAVQLTRTFYRALATGMPVDEALAHARAAIRVGLHNSLEWGTPVLYLRAPDGVLFTLSGTAKAAAPKSEPAQPPTQPATPGGFPNAQRAASPQAPGWGAPTQPGYPPSYHAPQPGYSAFPAPPSYEAPRPVVSPFNTPAPTLAGAPLSAPASGPTANESAKPERKKQEPKPLPAPKNQYDMMRLDKLHAKASSVGTVEVFLLGGVGALVGVMTQSWLFALATAVVLAVLAYVLGYRKLLSWLPFGIIAVASAAVVVALTFYVTPLPYDHQQISQFWFGIQRALTLRRQIIAGAGVGALASLCGFYVFDSSRKDSFETNFYVGAVFLGMGGGGVVWLVVSALGSIFNWGFGFGYGWLTGFLVGYLVTAIAGIGLITLLFVWKRTRSAWGLHDAARLRLEERFGDTLDKDLRAAVSQADEAAITALLPRIAKDSAEDLRALLKQGSTGSQQPASSQEAAQKPQDSARRRPDKPEPPAPLSTPPAASQPQAARQEPQRSADQQSGTVAAQGTAAAPSAADQPEAEVAAPPQKTLDQWFSEGMSHASAGRYNEALAAYDGALALDPTSAQVWKQKGDALHILRRHQEALAAYDRAAQFAPNEVDIWKSRGETLIMLRQYQEALNTYNHILKLTPNDVNIWNSTGETLESLERHQEALTAYDQALKLSPDDPLIWKNRGDTFVSLKRYQEAATTYERALQLAPNFVPAWNGKGILLQTLQRHQEAMAAFDYALQLAPNDPVTGEIRLLRSTTSSSTTKRSPPMTMP